MQKTVGDNASPEKIKEYLWSTLNSGQVVPGYGHGVLRSPDPRFIALQQFCDARPELSSSPVIRLVKQVSEIAPGVLKEHGKVVHSSPLYSHPLIPFDPRPRIPIQMLMLPPVSKIFNS
jgi:citrate synthase